MTPAAELVAQLHEGSSRYAGRGATASGRLRARTFAAFAEVGLPADAVPYVVEALRTELNPEVVAGAARATRGWAGAEPSLAEALLEAVANFRGRNAPVDLGEPTTVLLEVLAALRHQPAVGRAVVQRLRQLQLEGAADWDAGVRRALAETVAALQSRAGLSSFAVAEAAPATVQAAPDPADLAGVRVEDQDGVRLDLAGFLGRAPTVVAFFYTRCANPKKCSLTITKLADLQRRLTGLGMVGRQLAAISYDPGYDRPSRLTAYGRARGLRFDDTTRLFRAVEGHDRMRSWFGLRVGYNGSIVNQHGIELYLVEPSLRISRTWARIPWTVEEVASTVARWRIAT